MRIVVPASGGTVDLVARAVIPGLQQALGQSVIADAKPGASGNIAATLVAKSPGDGHTILTGFNPLVISTFLSKNLQYDLQKDRSGSAGLNSFAPRDKETAGRWDRCRVVHGGGRRLRRTGRRGGQLGAHQGFSFYAAACIGGSSAQ